MSAESEKKQPGPAMPPSSQRMLMENLDRMLDLYEEGKLAGVLCFWRDTDGGIFYFYANENPTKHNDFWGNPEYQKLLNRGRTPS